MNGTEVRFPTCNAYMPYKDRDDGGQCRNCDGPVTSHINHIAPQAYRPKRRWDRVKWEYVNED